MRGAFDRAAAPQPGFVFAELVDDCAGKEAWRTRREAERALAKHAINVAGVGGRVRTCPCARCDRWHIGRASR